MKRIVTHLLVAAGLAVGAMGAAQAHTDLHIGLSLGAPVYAQTAPVYVQPAPVYRAPVYGGYEGYGYHHEPRWDGHDRGNWNRAGWDHGGDRGNGYGRRG